MSNFNTVRDRFIAAADAAGLPCAAWWVDPLTFRVAACDLGTTATTLDTPWLGLPARAVAELSISGNVERFAFPAGVSAALRRRWTAIARAARLHARLHPTPRPGGASSEGG
jgi:hypothetical protein